MSSRPGIVVDHNQPADGGVTPNLYPHRISVQVRCHWPPLATEEEIRLALADGYLKAVAELASDPRVRRS